MTFNEYLFQQSGAEYSCKLLLIDTEGLEEKEQYGSYFELRGFTIIHYADDLRFRIDWENKLKLTECRIAVIAKPSDYIPYDIQKNLSRYEVSYRNIYPRLNSEYMRTMPIINHNLILRAYLQDYEKHSSADETKKFLQEIVYSIDNVSHYAEEMLSLTLQKVKSARSHKDWFEIANNKASIDVISAKYGIKLDTDAINLLFQDWALAEFGKQSSVIDKSSPVLVSNVMEYMQSRSEKYVVVVMDGMSEFDWSILSQSFDHLRYTRTSAFAMIPTVTSVSRQCLLGGKLPYKLDDPWHQAKEKNEFFECAKSLGFKDNQISYQRGYEADFDYFIHCGAVIIMEIDEIVHGQKQGRLGMYNDIYVMAMQHRLADLTERLLGQGFDVYITADHGNTPCIGIGKLVGSGVETETKSHRMIVTKDFAETETKKEKFGLIEYPKYYLPKENDYLICDVGTSFDTKGEQVINHGGVTLDEVVVPFIMLKAEDYHG